jgi:hypothetical protein
MAIEFLRRKFLTTRVLGPAALTKVVILRLSALTKIDVLRLS